MYVSERVDSKMPVAVMSLLVVGLKIRPGLGLNLDNHARATDSDADNVWDNDPSYDAFFQLWVVYSFAYWAIGLPDDDSSVLLVLVTLLHAGILAFGRWIPTGIIMQRRVVIRNMLVLLAIIPLSCNNLYLHPLLGLCRAALYSIVRLATPDRAATHWLMTMYILFSKIEALLPLMLWQLIVEVFVLKIGVASNLSFMQPASGNPYAMAPTDHPVAGADNPGVLPTWGSNSTGAVTAMAVATAPLSPPPPRPVDNFQIIYNAIQEKSKSK
jgi:hypothetical protein